MNQSDPYADWDAAYVLGALTVQQRHQYEDHLAGCPACRSAVGELAAMPGLLAQVPAAEATALSAHSAPADAAPVPESIRGLTPPRRLSLRIRLLLVAAVVLALIIGGIGGFLIHGAVAPPPPAARPPVLVAFVSDHPTSMIANARLTSAGQRTKIDVDCAYALRGAQGSTVDYALETVDDHGTRQRVWQWAAKPGEDHGWHGSSALPLDKIATLQIVNVDQGTVLMSAALH